MTELAFDLTLQRKATLTINERVVLLRKSLAQRENEYDRLSLSEALLTLVQDEEVVALLHERPATPALAFKTWLTLGRAHAGLENTADADAAFSQAVRAATTVREHSIALSELAGVHSGRGQLEKARTLLDEALGEDPLTPYAFSQLVGLHLEQDTIVELLELTDTWLADKRATTSVLTGRYLALLAEKHLSEAEHLAGLDHLVVSQDLPVPDGWPSIEAFNVDLERELLAHTGRRRPRSARTTGGRLRLDDLLLERSRVFPVLLEMLKTQIVQRARTLPPGHVWSEARPEHGLLRTWCTLTQDGGFDNWHIHPPAWMSGVYYVTMPDTAAAASDGRGCIELGMPDLPRLASAAGRRRLIKPRGGLLLMFPSHVYHRTYPPLSSRPRASIAFDVGLPGPDHARF
jgi:uncharacterized protein (TIGR02466 family)